MALATMNSVLTRTYEAKLNQKNDEGELFLIQSRYAILHPEHYVDRITVDELESY